jgi:hypothetical protein
VPSSVPITTPGRGMMLESDDHREPTIEPSMTRETWFDPR